MDEETERRHDVRTHASPPAQILRSGSNEQIEILNASYRGLFIRTRGETPMLNQLLKVRILLPTQSVVVHVVPVRIVTDAHGRPVGVGVRFFALSGEEKRIWESYIMALLAPRRAAA